MDDLREQLVSLKDTSDKIVWAERQRLQINIIGKTISLINKLEAVEKKLKTPAHTSGDLVKHMKLITELRLLYRTDEMQSPVNSIRREMELIATFYRDLLNMYQSAVEKFID